MTVITSPDGTTVAPFTDGYIYNLQSSLSVRADALSGVASVIFQLDGKKKQTENNVPYDVAGDIGSNCTRWTPAAGNHTLVATPYSKIGGKGTAGTPVTVTFTAQ
jgi:hypothetical protein